MKSCQIFVGNKKESSEREREKKVQGILKKISGRMSTAEGLWISYARNRSGEADEWFLTEVDKSAFETFANAFCGARYSTELEEWLRAGGLRQGSALLQATSPLSVEGSHLQNIPGAEARYSCGAGSK